MVTATCILLAQPWDSWYRGLWSEVAAVLVERDRNSPVTATALGTPLDQPSHGRANRMKLAAVEEVGAGCSDRLAYNSGYGCPLAPNPWHMVSGICAVLKSGKHIPKRIRYFIQIHLTQVQMLCLVGYWFHKQETHSKQGKAWNVSKLLLQYNAKWLKQQQKMLIRCRNCLVWQLLLFIAKAKRKDVHFVKISGQFLMWHLSVLSVLSSLLISSDPLIVPIPDPSTKKECFYLCNSILELRSGRDFCLEQP